MDFGFDAFMLDMIARAACGGEGYMDIVDDDCLYNEKDNEDDSEDEEYKD